MRNMCLFFKKTYDDLLASLVFVLTFCSLSFIPLRFDSISSICHKAIFAVIALWICLKIVSSVLFFNNIKRQKKDYTFINYKNILFFLTLLSIIVSFLTILITAKGQPLTTKLFTKYILFASIIGSVGLFTIIKISKLPLKILTISSILCSILLFCIWIFKARNDPAAHLGLSLKKNLTLYYSNPNLAGIITFTIAIVLLYSFFFYKNWFFKVLSLVCCVLSLILFYLTSSRASIIAILLAVFSFVIWFLLKKKKYTDSIASFLIPLIPLFFGVIYFIFFANYFPNGIYYASKDIVVLGKNLGSRYEVWLEAFRILSDPFKFVFGTYYEGCITSGAFHYHNGILDLFLTYGCVAFLISASVIFFVFYYILKNNKSLIFSSSVGIILLFFTFFLAISESGPFYSSNGIAFLWFSSILMARYPIGKSMIEEVKRAPLRKKDKRGLMIISNVYGVGSIGKIVQDCHLDNLKNGVSSYVIYGRGEQSDDFNAICVEDIYDVCLTKLFKKNKPGLGNFFMANEIINCIKNLKPSIVHIHAVNDEYVNYKRLFKYLAKHHIKTVYTNHSEWMYIGSCGGHAYSCKEYISSNCQNCPKQLKDASKIFDLKKDLIKLFKEGELVITSVSPWLKERSDNSLIFKEIPSYLVLDGNNMSTVSSKYNYEELIKTFDIPSAQKYVLFVSPSLSNPLKGFRYINELALLNPNYQFIVLTLHKEHDIVNLANNIKIINNVVNQETLKSFYEFADATIIASEQETFSMPVAESLCCGTPVVGFKAGGPESIVLSDYSKFIEYGNIDALNTALKAMLSKKIDSDLLIQEAMKKYSSSAMAESYRNVYLSLDKDYDIHSSSFSYSK